MLDCFFVVPYRACVAAVVVCAAVPALANGPTLLAQLSPTARTHLGQGRPVTELLAEPGVDLMLIAAVRSRVDAAVFLDRFRDIEQLLKGTHSATAGRFSDKPRIEDLSALTLDDEDVDDLRGCRPRRCGLKLSSAEIAQVRTSVASAGSGWRAAALEAFKRALLDRATAFRSRGLSGLMPYEDDDKPVNQEGVTRHQLDVLQRRGVAPAELLAYVRAYPAEAKGTESFLFWSKDALGDGKPIVNISHAAILQPGGHQPPIILMTQVYANHYLDGSVAITTLLPASDGWSTLIYLRLSEVDVVDGTFGGLIRRIMNRRVRNEGPRAIDTLRRKLETPVSRPDGRLLPGVSPGAGRLPT